LQKACPTASLEPHSNTRHSERHCQPGLELDQAKTDVVRLVRDRGSDDALKALPVYNDGQMYEWTRSRDRRRFDQYTIQGDQVNTARVQLPFFQSACPLFEEKQAVMLRRGNTCF
jgi:hypothetical protein